MADEPGPSSGPKAIGSLAKRSSDVTRQGTQRLKFVPTLPARRKKDEVKQEALPPPAQSPDKGNVRGRGRGRGRGGEGRGAAPRPPPAEMTASGPFSMGPALAGTSARRSNPRPNYTPIVPQGPVKGSTLGANLSNEAAPTLKKDKQRENPLASTAETPKDESDNEVYSEPDEGVEIIDMENVRQLDWMAPEMLQKDRRRKRQGLKVEFEETLLSSDANHPGTFIKDPGDADVALDLSESEDEEELEGLIEDFAIQTNTTEEGTRQERLYFFQFPEPFPTFVSASDAGPSREMDIDASGSGQGSSTLKRKVSFATDTKSPAPESGPSTSPEIAPEAAKVDGVIGHLEVYRSGMVKMRLCNGIVLNVSEATQPSFLQQAVHLDMENKKLHVLGEVNKRFMVSPDLDVLLASTETEDTGATAFDDANLIKMDAV